MEDDTRFTIATNGGFVRRSCSISEPDRASALGRNSRKGRWPHPRESSGTLTYRLDELSCKSRQMAYLGQNIMMPADNAIEHHNITRETRQAQHGWEHLSKEAQRLKIRPVEIIEAIRDDRITRVGNHMEWEGYAAVHVYHDEVAVVLLPDPVDAQSIENFAKAVGIGQPSILKRMIDEGHVQITIVKNPITKVDQAYFTAEDAVAFEEGYTTPKLLSQTHGASWQALVRRLRDAGIKPFVGKRGAFGNVYLREAIDRILR